MIHDHYYDVAIIGGGLAGLSATISLAQQGHRVVLIEKESYPFHKVCGEYVSMESWDFLQSIGLDLESMALPRVQQLMLTTASGKCFKINCHLVALASVVIYSMHH